MGFKICIGKEKWHSAITMWIEELRPALCMNYIYINYAHLHFFSIYSNLLGYNNPQVFFHVSDLIWSTYWTPACCWTWISFLICRCCCHRSSRTTVSHGNKASMNHGLNEQISLELFCDVIHFHAGEGDTALHLQLITEALSHVPVWNNKNHQGKIGYSVYCVFRLHDLADAKLPDNSSN